MLQRADIMRRACGLAWLLAVLIAASAGGTEAARAQTAGTQPTVTQPPPAPAPGGPTNAQDPSSQLPASAPRATGAATGTAPLPDTVQAPAAASTGTARPTGPELEIVAPIAGWQAELKSLSKAIERLRAGGAVPGSSGLGTVRPELERIAQDAAALINSLEPQLAATMAQRAKLGPAPAEGAPPEAEPIAAERARLNALVSALEGATGTSRAMILRTEQMIGSIQEIGRSRFAEQLLTRIDSPLLPELWRNVAREASSVGKSLAILLRDWWHVAAPQYRVFVLLLLAGSVWFLMNGVGRMIVRAIRMQDDPEHVPSFMQRSTATVSVALARTLPTLIACGYTYAGLGLLDLLPRRFDQLTQAALIAICIYAASTALVRALITPNQPQWRLIAIPEATIPGVMRLTHAIAGVYALDVFFNNLNRVLYAPVSITVAQSFIASILFAVLLIVLATRPMTPLTARQSKRAMIAGPWLLGARTFLLIAAAAIIAAAVFGYVALARFLAGQLIITGSILVMMTMMHLAIRSIVEAWVTAHGVADDPRQRLIGAALNLLLNLIMLTAMVPLILLQWGTEWADLRAWLSSALFGFEIGGMRLSLSGLLIGLALLVAGILLTRALQRWLDSSILNSPRVDPGLANSVRTGTGYVGFLASAVIAVSYAGIDFTNLAIVAGALSVGIGFGLQSVVNNFVSGLILLIERPIKVGDWITVGAEEGYVRQISVRSTEIETFDRSNVIIPNSELISGRVTNWTHRNSMGRIVIRVGVGYSSDAEQVMEILRLIAASHPKVLDWPQPVVVFEDFGASSLDFSVRAFIPNVNEIVGIKTEMRLAMLKEFRQAGIEIPFPQQDLHLRDLDGIKSTLARVAAERARKAGNEDA